ncbi:TraB/GumN family protein [Luteimonas composti]|uniref:TraB/GumN family protein n=1 Tax=Luteimonas composti TaxID=398257 RepID=A0ABT6MPD1_9GAMM|nr:TraB/GumN family protein [Luteimonas composti]MDH7452479.1 TraB/GumN family protein [Luteimonas composti]
MRLRRNARRSFRSALALATLLALAGAAHADAAREQAPVPLMWKVSDQDSSLYLLGSFHLLKPADYPLSRDIDVALADAEQVVFEIPPEELGSPMLGMQMGQAALRTDGTGLDSELPEQTRQALAEWTRANAAPLEAMKLPAQALQMFEPWFVGLMVTVVEMGKAGLDPTLGLDTHLARRAGETGKATAGLETGVEQIAFLDGMDRAEQLQFLQQALEGAAEGPAEIDKLHSAWRNGDAAALWEGMAADMRREFPDLYRRINVERNAAWVPKLEAKLQAPEGDDVLVVVGALHLLGEDGVVEQLRAKGYEVERICSACSKD